MRGLKSKLTTVQRIINEENPVLVALVETKMREGEEIQLAGYKSIRCDRAEEGGGVMLAYKETLSNIIVVTREYKENDCEMLWLKIDNTRVKLKIGIVYMPQESRTKLDVLKEIYEIIEAEAKDASEHGESLLILGDLNCKVGESIIGNTEEITKGGRLLRKMIQRNKLSIVNSQRDICKGLWTRIEGIQKSIIDYVICFEEDLGMFKEVEIDEEKDITPYHTDDEGRKYTDHCMISGTLDITVMENLEPKYIMTMGKAGWKKFRCEIERRKISNIIDDRCIKTTYTEWNDEVLKIKRRCSKKTKLRRKWKVNRKLTAAKKSITRELKQRTDKLTVEMLKVRRRIIIEQIEEEEKKHQYSRVNKVVDDVKRAGGINSSTFWEVRKKLCNIADEPAHAIKNRDGELCDEPEEIKKVYAEWYQELLKTRTGETEIEKQAEEVVSLLWKSMENIAASQPARKTTYKEVENIVKKLDPKKAKDAANWKNNVMKEGGSEMIKSLNNIIDKVDEQRNFPNEWHEMQIKTTHKRGERTDMSNKRGLFLTNNVSKVYERVVKSRNEENFHKGITPWSTGGVKWRSTVDNKIILTSIIEQNKYLKRIIIIII